MKNLCYQIFENIIILMVRLGFYCYTGKVMQCVRELIQVGETYPYLFSQIKMRIWRRIYMYKHTKKFWTSVLDIQKIYTNSFHFLFLFSICLYHKVIYTLPMSVVSFEIKPTKVNTHTRTQSWDHFY